MTAASAQKVKRHIDLCDTFHLPMVSLVDEPGFMIGPEAEQSATIRYGTATIFAPHAMHHSLGVCHRPQGLRRGRRGPLRTGRDGVCLAVGREWRPATGGGVAVAYRREIAAAPDPEAKRREIEEALASKRSVYARAEGFAVHDMIDPRHTRPVLCDWVDWIQPQLSAHTGPPHLYNPALAGVRDLFPCVMRVRRHGCESSPAWCS